MPSFFLTPDFNTRPDSDRIRVGHIIKDAADPTDCLNADTYEPPPAETLDTITVKGFSATRSKIRSGEVSAWAKILESASLGVGVNASSDKEDVFAIETVETVTMWLAKKAAKDYIQRYIDDEEVQKYLKAGKFRYPVFIITGVKVARGAKSVNSHDNQKKGVDVQAMVDVTPSGIPVQVGPKAEWKAEGKSETSFKGGDDFVFAYQLTKLVCSKKAGLKKVEKQVKGALFDGDLKRSEEEEIEIEVKVEENENLDGFDLGDDAEVIRIQDKEGEDDVCIIPGSDDF